MYIHILYTFSPIKGVEMRIKTCVFFKFFLPERVIYIPREMFSFCSSMKNNFELIVNLLKYKYVQSAKWSI